MDNYFTLLSLPESYALDMAGLERSYFTGQRLYHPDRLRGKSEVERQQAILRSMLLNEAYEALKSPLKRARHLLALRGIRVGGENDTHKPDMAILTEIMELREALAEQEKSAVKSVIQSRLQETERELESLFAAQAWNDAAQAVIRFGYLLKLAEDAGR